MDHQGHGKSLGDRAHVENFQNFVDDAIQFVKIIVNEYINSLDYSCPTFLMGHSMV